MNNLYPVTARSKLRRRPQRGAYDRPSVYGVLDAGVLCHVGYVINNQPFVTPTAYWRQGDHVYWHGSAASRMLESVAGKPVCLTVSHLDGLVLARSAFHHSVNYRSVMVFGTAFVVAEPAEKRVQFEAFIERLYPGRSKTIRAPSDKEMAATTVIGMEIEEASAKIRATGVIDDEEDYALPVWAGVVPTNFVLGEAAADQRLLVEPGRPPDLAEYAANARLDAVLLKSAVAGANAQK
jgi:nitroimidazol reductase NimA-like FMN-containing flavoprotein (pyridoxamine 5'-phosphate oxidase superfamily)